MTYEVHIVFLWTDLLWVTLQLPPTMDNTVTICVTTCNNNLLAAVLSASHLHDTSFSFHSGDESVNKVASLLPFQRRQN